MADEIDYTLHGEGLQLVEIHLDPGEGVRAEVGALAFMEQPIKMQTGTGGLFAGFKRILTGESFFICTFVNDGQAPASVGFAAPYPGKVVPIDLTAVGPFHCQKDSFLCAAHGVDIAVSFTRKLGAGLYGGSGFVLQKLEGEGLAFVHAGGTIIRRRLDAGQDLRVDTGCLVGFSGDIDYDIQFVGGFRNALFGGEGLFLACLSGPGEVYLQSLPFSRLADRIHAVAPPAPAPARDR